MTDSSLPPPHVGPVVDEQTGRARFSRHELAIVLSHYDVGRIERIEVCPLGSGRAPKVRVRTERGDYFLKRRAPDRCDVDRVAFTHAVQRQLAGWGYPVPRIISTRGGAGDHPSVLELEGRVYELFEFVEGERPDRSVVASARSGAALGRLHALLEGWDPPLGAPRGTYHGSDEVDDRLRQARKAIRRVEPDFDRDELRALVHHLADAYHEAAARVEEAGYRSWSPRLLHGDWHPGNLIFRAGDVVAVLDFDSARLEPRMSDVANGALQFSIRMGGDDPLAWPEGLDPRRIKVFLREYDATGGRRLTADERSALPWLIIEALVVESIVPIAATGRFSRIRGSDFLRMIRAKIDWLRPRARDLLRYLNEEGDDA